MKKIIPIFIISLFIVGCSGNGKSKDLAVKINNYEISQAEFEQEFQNSIFGRVDTPESRKEFLDNLINRILILQDAQNKGLDNDPKFLKIVEKFWVQSLLKLALEKNARDLDQLVSVDDQTVKKAYQKMAAEGKTTKTYEEMYKQLRWELVNIKKTQVMNEWFSKLRNNSDIRVNKNLILKVKQGGRDGK